MADFGDYMYNKRKTEYALYLQGEVEHKVRALVRHNGKYMCICTKNNKFGLPGGSVDSGEDNDSAILREIREEINVNASIVKYLGKYTYTRHLAFDNKQFNIVRVEHLYLCDFVSYSDHNIGMPGEFDDNTIIVDLTYDEVMDYIVKDDLLGMEKNKLLRLLTIKKKYLI